MDCQTGLKVLFEEVLNKNSNCHQDDYDVIMNNQEKKYLIDATDTR